MPPTKRARDDVKQLPAKRLLADDNALTMSFNGPFSAGPTPASASGSALPPPPLKVESSNDPVATANRLLQLQQENEQLEQRLRMYKQIIKSCVSTDMAARIVDPQENFARRLCEERVEVLENFVNSFNNAKSLQDMERLVAACCESHLRVFSSCLPTGETDQTGLVAWLGKLRFQQGRRAEMEITQVEPEECHGQHLRARLLFVRSPGEDKRSAVETPPIGHLFVYFGGIGTLMRQQTWVWNTSTL